MTRRLNIALWALSLAALACRGGTWAPPGESSLDETDVVDAVHLSVRRDRSAHDVRWVRGELSSAFATFGRLRVPIRGISLTPGGVLYVTVETGHPERTAIAVRLATAPEHHGRAQSYSVEADGVELCAATDADPGAGASRTVYADLVPGARYATLRIRAGWRNTFPIVAESIRTYRAPADPGGGTVPAAPYVMGLALLTPRGHGFAMDLDEMRAIRSRIPASAYLTPQAAVLYNFCRKDLGAQMAAMRGFADLATRSGLPLRVLPQMHWAGIPAGVSDGAGGTFSDVPYQQITWDPDDRVHDPGLRPLLGERYDVRYGLSVPNRWSNTPWLTFNHPRLNQYRRAKLVQALTAWVTVRERLARWGQSHLLPADLSTGEETVYWAKGVDDSAYTEANGGKPRSALLADFNPFVIADALADRIILDPSNGLDRNERRWLHQNLGRWQQTIVDWMLEAVPPEPVKVAGASVLFAEDTVRRNIYTEPYAMPIFPMRGVNTRRPGLEAGYVREARSGGEYWSGATMLPLLIKERERGRIALPNLECTGADDGQLVACILAAYGHGARYATLYNWHHRSNVKDLLTRVADAIKTPDVIAVQSVSSPPPLPGDTPSARWEYTYQAGPGAYGVNVVSARVPPAGTERRLRITIRTLDEKAERRSSALATPVAGDPRAQVYAARLPCMFHQKPGERYAVEVAAADGTPVSGAAPAVAVLSDVRLERWRSMAVGDLQDAADIIESLERRDREPWSNSESSRWLDRARYQLRRGRPRTAYRSAIRAEQLLFPASYSAQPPGGDLRPFPISVSCPDDRVRLTIRALSREVASLTVSSTVKQTIEVRYRGKSLSLDLTPDVPVSAEIEVGALERGATVVRRMP